MIAWSNILILAVATLFTWLSYLKSVGPARLAKKIGPEAYAKCAGYRIICLLSMMIVMGNYILYYFHPLPITMPARFPWSWSISIWTALLVMVPTGYVLIRALLAAGQETFIPKPEHTMYGGVYKKIRHPQALAEIGLWFVFGLLLNSPFLAVYSLVWIPIVIHWCIAEDRDLLIRYGAAYREYRQRTWAFIPGIW
jgi:protein-S-isoprenylcysteine O-methyltransferase Ste14